MIRVSKNVKQLVNQSAAAKKPKIPSELAVRCFDYPNNYRYSSKEDSDIVRIEYF